ncbi:MAG: alpha-amylase family glycosyl hydrolase [Clostridia bacterium]
MNSPNWLKKAVFYEIYPQSFLDTNSDGIGDLNGVIAKLDYVKSLGCNAIWLNPCFLSPFMDAGYDVEDFYKVAPRYGTNETLYTLFKQAHSKGIHIILDLVAGHTSDKHKWFVASSEPQRNEYSDRYIWTNSVWNKSKDYSCVSGMSNRDGCYILNFFNSQPALNYGYNTIAEPWQMSYKATPCVETFDELMNIMRFWLDHGCDGFRVDMADSLVKNDPDKVATASLWQRARKMLDECYPEAILVSEWSNPTQSLGKAGFDCDFVLDHDNNFYHKMCRNYDYVTKKDNSYFSKNGNCNFKEALADLKSRYNESKDKGYLGLITCNHDTPRMSRRLDEYELRIAYAFIFTMPGIPFLYYGDEIGMKYIENLVSKEGGYNRTGTRTPMQWNNETNCGFSEADKNSLYLPVETPSLATSVEKESADKHSLLAHIKKLLAFRASEPSFEADKDFEIMYATDGYPFVYRRGNVICAVNPSLKSVTAPIRNAGEKLFTFGESISDGNSISLGKQSFAVYRIVK